MRARILLAAATASLLLSAPAAAQTPMQLSVEKLQSLIDLVPTLCAAAFATTRAGEYVTEHGDAVGWDLYEKLTMNALCQSYGHGTIAGLNKAKSIFNR